jgi:hypothetical protein
MFEGVVAKMGLKRKIKSLLGVRALTKGDATGEVKELRELARPVSFQAGK